MRDDKPRVTLRATSEVLTIACDGLSSELVASSNRRMRGLRAMARAIITRCRWPPESVFSPSATTVPMPIGIALDILRDTGEPGGFPRLIERQVKAAADVLVETAGRQPSALEGTVPSCRRTALISSVSSDLPS